MQDVSEQLRSFAQRRRINQSELAARIGVSQPTISRLLNRPNERQGPAHRRVVAFLEEAAKADIEYTSIHNLPYVLARHLEHLAPGSDLEAEAVDKLLTAIENYVAVKTRVAQ